MNFIPQEELQKVYHRRISYLVWGIFILQLPLFINYIFYQPYRVLQEKQIQLQSLNQKLENPIYQSTLEKLKVLEQLSQTSKQVKKSQWITTSLIQCLFEHLPKDMSIKTLDMIEEQHQVILKGHAKEALVILDYQQFLEQMFGIGYVTSLFEPTQEIYLYEITIKLTGEQLHET